MKKILSLCVFFTISFSCISEEPFTILEPIPKYRSYFEKFNSVIDPLTHNLSLTFNDFSLLEKDFEFSFSLIYNENEYNPNEVSRFVRKPMNISPNWTFSLPKGYADLNQYENGLINIQLPNQNKISFTIFQDHNAPSLYYELRPNNTSYFVSDGEISYTLPTSTYKYHSLHIRRDGYLILIPNSFTRVSTGYSDIGMLTPTKVIIRDLKTNHEYELIPQIETEAPYTTYLHYVPSIFYGEKGTIRFENDKGRIRKIIADDNRYYEFIYSTNYIEVFFGQTKLLSYQIDKAGLNRISYFNQNIVSHVYDISNSNYFVKSVLYPTQKRVVFEGAPSYDRKTLVYDQFNKLQYWTNIKRLQGTGIRGSEIKEYDSSNTEIKRTIIKNISSDNILLREEKHIQTRNQVGEFVETRREIKEFKRIGSRLGTSTMPVKLKKWEGNNLQTNLGYASVKSYEYDKYFRPTKIQSYNELNVNDGLIEYIGYIDSNLNSTIFNSSACYKYGSDNYIRNIVPLYFVSARVFKAIDQSEVPREEYYRYIQQTSNRLTPLIKQVEKMRFQSGNSGFTRIEKYNFDSKGRLVSYLAPQGAITEIGYSTGTPSSIKHIAKQIDDVTYFFEEVISRDYFGRILEYKTHSLSEGTSGSSSMYSNPNRFIYDNFGRVLIHKRVNNGAEELISFAKYTDPGSDRNGGNRVEEIKILDNLKCIRTITEYNENYLPSIIDKYTAGSYTFQANQVSVSGDKIHTRQIFKYHPLLNDLPISIDYYDGTTLKYQDIFQYDGFGRLLVLKKKIGAVEVTIKTTTYDDTNRLVVNEYPTSRQMYRDGNGIILPISQSTRKIYTKYDWKGNIIEVYGDSQPVSYKYNEFGFLMMMIQNGKNINYSYNSLGEVLSVIYHNNEKELFSYDLEGRVVQKMNRNGNVIQFIYNKSGQLIETRVPASETILSYTLKNTYNLFGLASAQRVSASNLEVSNEYVYNLDGLVEESTQRIDNNTKNFSIKYGYNRQAQTLFKEFYRDSSLIDTGTYSYEYPFTKLTNLAETKYNYNNQIEDISYGSSSSLRSRYSYDEMNNLNSINTFNASGTKVHENSYVIDVRGNIASWNNEQYTYDLHDRLRSSTADTYNYDGFGNRSMRNGSVYSFSTQNPYHLSYYDGWSFNFDSNGNMVRKAHASAGEWKFNYDGMNRLQTVERNSIPIGSYLYNAAGLRVKKIEGGKTSYYMYEGNNCVYEETFSSGVMTEGRVHHYLDGKNVVDRNVVTGGITYNVLDHLGSRSAVFTSQGVITDNITYSDFGEKKTGSSDNYRYTDKMLDSNTNLTYINQRYYDSTIGRFLTEDPAKDGLNWYIYCNNNPLKFTDPDGLAAILSRPINSGTKWYYNLANFVGTKFGIFHHWLVDRNGLDFVDKVAQYSGSESGITYSDKNSPIRTYTIKFSNLDDAITEKALKNVIASDQFGNGDKDKQKQLYKVFANDCKDFTTAVFNEYKSLWMQRDKENNTNNPEYNADASWDAHYKEITKQQGEKVDFSKAGE